MNEDDPDRRMQFCREMQDRANTDEYFIRNICFSDEATCFINGELNRHNMRYWSAENPNWMEGIRAQGEAKVRTKCSKNARLGQLKFGILPS
jgi:hypothetical protein